VIYIVAVSDAGGQRQTISDGLGSFSQACLEALDWASKLSADPDICNGTAQKVDIMDSLGYVELSVTLPIGVPRRYPQKGNA